jgi:NodT family efflux transporter outer membrane factor (OMF) lipoprotein
MIKPLVNSPRWPRGIAALLLCLAASGCTAGPDYHAPEMHLPAFFTSAFGNKPASTQAPTGKPVVAADVAARWWKSLGDPELNRLIDAALRASPRLDSALFRLQAARERVAAVTGEALPEIGAGYGGARGTGSDLARGRALQPLVAGENTNSLKHVDQISGFDARWEIDLFGKYRREAEAARADAQAQAAARNDVLVSLIADVVRAYVDLRGRQAQLAVLRRNIDTARDYVRFVKLRYDRGITNGLDLTIARRELETLRSRQAPLQAEVDAARNALAVLCGAYPEAMAKELGKTGKIPTPPQEIRTGVPLDLLRRRPDIAQAERNLAAATALTGAAVADLFPHLSLAGGVGDESLNLGLAPPASSFIWSLGPSVSIPLLDFGTLDARVNVADYKTKAALAVYRETILEAVRDVDTAASAFDAQRKQLANLKTALESAREAVNLATERFDRGLTDSLNVIDAERQQYDLEQQYAAARQTEAEQFVALYKALGAGWQDYQKIPPMRQPQPALVAAVRHLSDKQ